jgi:hypothetical protein
MECGYDVIIVILTILRAHISMAGEVTYTQHGRRPSLPQVLVRDGLVYFW